MDKWIELMTLSFVLSLMIGIGGLGLYSILLFISLVGIPYLLWRKYGTENVKR